MTTAALAWARAFALTLGVELLVAPPLLGPPASRARRVAAPGLANLASHPLVWLVIPELGLPWPAWVVVAELWAFTVEAASYTLILGRPRRALVAALCANVVSLGVGLALRRAGFPL